MGRRGRPATVLTRDPIVESRDLAVENVAAQRRKPRRYIPASMPCVCPECGHNTRMDDGRYVDPARKTILEYRTCCKCGIKLAAGRSMTEQEAKALCSRAEAVEEYHEQMQKS